jgi:hypothetical protein
MNRIEENPGIGVMKIHNWMKILVEPLVEDRSMTEDCERVSNALLNGELSNLFR